MTANQTYINESGLKLQVQDSRDLEILSSLLQDGLVAGPDLFFDRAARQFFMIINRFCWEKQPRQPDSSSSTHIHARTLCGLRINQVRQVRRKGLSGAANKPGFYNLLAIRYASEPNRLEWLFSGAAALQMDLDRLDISAADLAPDHPAFARPDHGEQDQG